MARRLCATLPTLVVFVFLLLQLGVGCGDHGAKSREIVSVDLTRLLARQDSCACSRKAKSNSTYWDDPSSPPQIALAPIDSVRSIPESVRSLIPKMSNPRGPFNPGCVSLFFDTPQRRLIFGGGSERYCLVHYEYGGDAHGYKTALFAISGNQAMPLWFMQAAGMPAWKLAGETDPDQLTNEVDCAIF